MPARCRPVPSQASLASPSDRETCLYISEMCSELRHLAEVRRRAGRPRFRTISYLLDMARLESEKMEKELPD